MGTLWLHYPWVYLYLLYVLALFIAFICALPDPPKKGARPGRRQDGDHLETTPGDGGEEIP
jgi:hypothetical protein